MKLEVMFRISNALFVFILWATVLHGVETTCNKACENGGQCVLSPVCSCPPSHTGEFCENIPPKPSMAICDPPCTAGQGECVVLQNSQLAPHLKDRAYCNCSKSATVYFYGKQCQHYQQNANCPYPCPSGYECDITGRCKCEGPSTGVHPTECLAQCTPACVHGVCRGGRCSCDSNSLGRYEGPTCETFTPYTCSEPCENDAKCESNGCRCRSNSTHYISGPTCAIVQVCIGGCLNGGLCGDGSTCQCTKECTGVNCNVCTDCPCQNNGTCIGGECICQVNYTGTFRGDLCETFNCITPCYPSVLNGGVCSMGYRLCPYDEIGYFHGLQCEQYSFNRCGSGCLEPEVCVGGNCRCPYDLAEGYLFFNEWDRKCSRKFYLSKDN